MFSHKVLKQSWTAKVLAIIIVLFSFQISTVNAAMITTDQAIQTEHQQYTKSELIQALESTELQQQLQDMGVDPKVLEERIASLTPTEISKLNDQLQQQPAGEGILGLAALLFIVFIITDALCATDLFSFVHCVNR